MVPPGPALGVTVNVCRTKLALTVQLLVTAAVVKMLPDKEPPQLLVTLAML